MGEEKIRRKEKQRKRKRNLGLEHLLCLEFMFRRMEFMFGTLLLFGTLGFVG